MFKMLARYLLPCLLLCSAVSASAHTTEDIALSGVVTQLPIVGVGAEFGGHEPEVVYFKSGPAPPPSKFKRRIAEKNSLNLEPPEPLTILGQLYMPDGDPPFPAVVQLHGSGGIWYRNEIWSKRLRDWGYVVLNVDSMTPRGIYRYNTLNMQVRPSVRARYVDAFTRSRDAHGARAYLSNLPYVDPIRIAVIGMSQGGSALMHALGVSGNPNVSGNFLAGVALYPRCEMYTEYQAPLLVLSGSADTYVSAEQCELRLSAVSAGKKPIHKIYDGAHHSFDVDVPELKHAGKIERYDPQAAEDAISRIKAFLSEHLD